VTWRAIPLVLALAWPAAAAAEKIHGVPLPPGTRARNGEYRSSRAYRKTVEYYKRFLRRSATPARRIATYERRGVTLTRFLSKAVDSPWRAIHVYRNRGTTWIHVVPRAAP
jgi:hypothetical protein